MTSQQTGKEVSGDVAPLLRRATDRVGSEADPIHLWRRILTLLTYPLQAPDGWWL